MYSNILKLMSSIALTVGTICLFGQEPNHLYRWSWIKESPATVDNTPINKVLESVSGTMIPMICVFDSTQNLKARKIMSLKKEGDEYVSKVSMGDNEWDCRMRLIPDDSRSLPSGVKAYKFSTTFKLTKGSSKATSVAVTFDFDNWSRENYVLLPSAAYNGNRFGYFPVSYPSIYRKWGDSKPGVPPQIPDITKLSVDNRALKMENGAGDTSTPMVGFWDNNSKSSFYIFTKYGTHLGQSGLIVEENKDFDKATVVISAPTMREYYCAGSDQQRSPDVAPNWNVGDNVTLDFCLMVDTKSPSLSRFFKVFAENRKILTGQNEFRHRIPFSKAYNDQLVFQNSPTRWNDKYGYYRSGNGEDASFIVGWVGGMVQSYSLLMRGDELSVKRLFSTLDIMMNKMQKENGFFYGNYTNGKIFGDISITGPQDFPTITMVRKNTDALYFLLKHLMYMKDNNIHTDRLKKYEVATDKLANALVTLYKRYNEFGQHVDIETGELFSFGSTAPASAPAALALASQYFNNNEYMEIAKKSAEMYYNRDVKKGYTTGGPQEILQCPDSESAFAMLESFVVLYEITRDPKWISMAKDMANICSSWVVSYDFQFPATSTLGKIHARSTGAVWASIQNRHAAPGPCVNSGDCLLKLYRITGDPIYVNLLKDISHNILEFVSTKEMPLTCAEDGRLSERVNISDWEGRWSLGDVGQCNSTAWCEVAIMNITTEIPSMYIQPDKGTLVCFDHLEATITQKNKNGVEITIVNPTIYDAKASILAEKSSVAKQKSLGWNIYNKLPKVNIPSGESKVIFVNNTGEVTISKN